MAGKQDVILSRPIVPDYSADVPIKHVENMMAAMFAGELSEPAAGIAVVHLFGLWVDGMTRVMANYLQEWK